MEFLSVLAKVKALWEKVQPFVTKFVARKEYVWFAAGFAAAKLLSCLVS